MAIFRLLHVSDLHLAEDPYSFSVFEERSLRGPLGARRRWLGPSSYDLDVATSVARWVWRHASSINAILVTGDLATTGRLEDLQAAHEFVDAPGASSWYVTGETGGLPTLRGRPVRVLLLPGNHDRYVGPTYLPAGETFDRVFARYWSGRQGVHVFPRLVLANECLTVVGADLSLRSTLGAWPPALVPPAWMGQGRAYKDVVRQLTNATGRARHDDGLAAVVWAVHFDPACSGGSWTLDLLRRRRLAEAASAAGVEHLFCGHTHRHGEPEMSGYPRLQVHCAGPATICSSRQKNTIHPVEIEVLAGKVVRVTWQTLEYRDGDFS